MSCWPVRRPDAVANRRIAETVTGLYAADDADAFIEADLAFHRAVYAAADNELLLYLYEMIGLALQSVRHVHALDLERNKEALPQHERIAEAIRRRHHRRAEEAMREVVEIARNDATICCGS